MDHWSFSNCIPQHVQLRCHRAFLAPQTPLGAIHLPSSAGWGRGKKVPSETRQPELTVARRAHAKQGRKNPHSVTQKKGV